jgi:hypothetical protein
MTYLFGLHLRPTGHVECGRRLTTGFGVTLPTTHLCIQESSL